MRIGFCGLLFVSLGLVVPTGCGDDDDTGADAAGTEGSGDSTAATGSTTGDMTTGSTTAADASADGSDSSSSTGPSEVAMAGNIQDFLLGAPIAGASISVYDMPGLEAVSDADGNFSVGPLAPDTEIAFVVAPSAGDPDEEIPAYVGAIIPDRTGTEDRDDVQLSQVQEATLQMQIDLLMSQMPEEPDPTQGVVIVRLVNGTTLQTGNVEVTMDPPPAADTYYAPDSNGSPVLNSQTIAFSILPVVVYFNLPDSDPDAITVTATHPVRECSTDHTLFPVLGGHITLVDLSCV